MYKRIFNIENSPQHIKNKFDFTGQGSSDLIKQKLLGSDPVMICRFGSGELATVVNYLNIKKGFKKYIEYIQGKIEIFWWDKDIVGEPFHNNGLFPITEDTFIRFSERMIEDTKSVDILGSWLSNESFLKEELKNSVKIELPDLEPYYHKNPWRRGTCLW